MDAQAISSACRLGALALAIAVAGALPREAAAQALPGAPSAPTPLAPPVVVQPGPGSGGGAAVPTRGRRRRAAAGALLAPVASPSAPVGATVGASLLLGFEGLNDVESFCGCIPPDGALAVGPDHVVAAVNTALMVWSKAGARLLAAPTDLTTLVAPLHSRLSETTDPFLLYDAAADRFVLSVGVNDGAADSGLDIAVTQTNDPTGAWSVYQVDVLRSQFIDFPHGAVGSDAIYVCADVYDSSTFNVVADRVYAVERAALYAGGTPVVVHADAPPNAGGAQADTLMPAQNAAGAPAMYFLSTDAYCTTCSIVSLYRWSAPLAGGALALAGGVTVTSYAQPPDADDVGAPQSVATNDASNLETWWHDGTLYGAHSVGIDLGAGPIVGVQWYQVGGIDATPALLQQGLQVGADASRFFPSLAVDPAGNLLLVYSASSLADFVGVRAAARRATDRPGQLRPEVVLQAGTSAVSTTYRWGDYGTTVYDASSGQFWTFLEYENGAYDWDTFVGEVGVEPDFSLAVAPATASAGAGAAVTLTASIAPLLGYAGTVSLAAQGLPAGASATFSSGAIAGGAGATTLTISTTAAVALGSYAFAVVAKDASGAPSHTAAIALDVLEPSAAGLVASPSPAVFGGTVTLTATVTSPAAAPPGGLVTFFDGASALGSASLATGVATLSFAPAGGARTLHAAYGGDAATAPCTSPPVALLVGPGPVALSLTASPDPAALGETVTLTALVAAAAGVPAGVVAFVDGATALGVAPLVSGTATLAVSGLRAGAHTLEASYPGDASFAPARASIVEEVRVTSLHASGSGGGGGGCAYRADGGAPPGGLLPLAAMAAAIALRRRRPARA